jgi:hypothetical protein
MATDRASYRPVLICTILYGQYQLNIANITKMTVKKSNIVLILSRTVYTLVILSFPWNKEFGGLEITTKLFVHQQT